MPFLATHSGLKTDHLSRGSLFKVRSICSAKRRLASFSRSRWRWNNSRFCMRISSFPSTKTTMQQTSSVGREFLARDILYITSDGRLRSEDKSHCEAETYYRNDK